MGTMAIDFATKAACREPVSHDETGVVGWHTGRKELIIIGQLHGLLLANLICLCCFCKMLSMPLSRRT